MYASKKELSRTGKHWAGQRVHMRACNAAVMQDDFRKTRFGHVFLWFWRSFWVSLADANGALFEQKTQRLVVIF